jgi:hypothetical protein
LKKCNQCPVCRYELATDDAEYEQKRLKRMEDRKLRLSMPDLKAKSVHELIRLAEHLQVLISDCHEKREIIGRIADSPLVEIIDKHPELLQASAPSTAAKLLVSRQELAQRLAGLDNGRITLGTSGTSAEATGIAGTSAEATGPSPMPSSRFGDLAGEIMAELRQTAARLEFQLDDPAARSDSNQHRSCLTSVGQSIIGNDRNTASSGGA